LGWVQKKNKKSAPQIANAKNKCKTFELGGNIKRKLKKETGRKKDKREGTTELSSHRRRKKTGEKKGTQRKIKAQEKTTPSSNQVAKKIQGGVERQNESLSEKKKKK